MGSGAGGYADGGEMREEKEACRPGAGDGEIRGKESGPNFEPLYG